MTTPMLRAQGLHTYLGDSHILRGIDLDLAPGASLGLLGRNGMGKTTLIRTLLGYVKPRQGRVAWLGEDVTGQPPERITRRGIGYVPEGRGIFPNLSVRENLVMAARPPADGPPVWTLERVLATFPRLAERLGHGGQQLSGGEQQMLTIGRALMTNPRLLILDEATEGLAPLVRAEIWRCLERVKAVGQSILVIDKNVRALTRIADTHYILEKGRIVWTGSSAELAAHEDVQHRYLGV
jgi:branched-chain amino acid transport system ATP-binding protein